ncbi:unnamed protein product [Urochloa decumbens]|uniref:Uncharacterized protein n=1 Tax=Urochloa decumbens TaxID=240449 RepID=A0ABC9EMI2_9POAL
MVGLKEMARLDAARQPPAWLRRLLNTKFFEPCPEHPAVTASRSTRSFGCNLFCTDCVGSGALCSGCVAAGHEGHRIVQVRKSSAHCMVRVSDVEHLLSVSQVQTYLINGEEAVFLDKREMSALGCKVKRSRLPPPPPPPPCIVRLFVALPCRFLCVSEDWLDFNMSFAVDPRNDSSGEESSESGSDDD